MNIRTSLRTIGIGAATLVGALAVSATPASAATFYIDNGAENCPYGQVCMYRDYNFYGVTDGYAFGRMGTNANIPDMYKIINVGFNQWKGMQDLTSSVVNNTGKNVCFYENNNYTGLKFRIGPWERWGQVPGWINDKISSVIVDC